HDRPSADWAAARRVPSRAPTASRPPTTARLVTALAGSGSEPRAPTSARCHVTASGDVHTTTAVRPPVLSVPATAHPPRHAVASWGSSEPGLDPTAPTSRRVHTAPSADVQNSASLSIRPVPLTNWSPAAR